MTWVNNCPNTCKDISVTLLLISATKRPFANNLDPRSDCKERPV